MYTNLYIYTYIICKHILLLWIQFPKTMIAMVLSLGAAFHSGSIVGVPGVDPALRGR